MRRQLLCFLIPALLIACALAAHACFPFIGAALLPH